MTNAGATPLSARGHSPRHAETDAPRPRRTGRTGALALPFGLGCGVLGALCALAATNLPFPSHPAATAGRPVAAPAPASEPVRRAALTPAVALPRHEKRAVRTAAPAPVRHRMAPPVVMTWLPAHVLAAPRVAEASRFDAAAVVVSDLEASRSFVPPPAEPIVAVAAIAPPMPAAIQVAVAVPAAALPPAAVPAIPATAEEALEAALVPTPRARPDHAAVPSTVQLRTRPVPPAAALAYARPDAGAEEPEKPLFGGLFTRQPPRANNGVAIYDIGAATVYLPNGERLEAHSGLGAMRDNPRFVHAKNRGPTPPHTYDLRLRESLFHGVQAIRLTPVGGERRIYNRVGLLAHTYMLGARGDSNGCVSFKDYKRFLAAFRRGDVRRLVVVSHMSDPSSRLASLFGRRG